MSLDVILQEYDRVANDCRVMIESELGQYADGESVPGEDFLARKKSLIERMDDLLSRLRSLQSSGGQGPVIERNRLNLIQQKFMQVLRLDRELEKTLLARRSRPSSSVSAPLRPTTHAANLYRNAAQGQSVFSA